ncbi:MAG: tetratricopeptide repeat-containing sulfotransferase family protein, partial [Gammaproteobacteria bacterium]
MGAYREYLEDHPGAATVWHTAAGCAFALRDYQSTLDTLERAVAEAPGNAEYLADLGGLHLQLNQPLAAEPVLARAVALAPNAINPLYNYCNVLFATNQVADAIRHLEQLIAIEPRFVDAHFNLGVAFRSLDQPVAARLAFTKVLALEPEHARAHLELAGLHRAAGSVERSLPHYECYLRANPQDVTVIAHFALACYESGEFDRALELMREARAHYGPHGVITGITGRLLINTGRIAEAERLFRRDLESDTTRIAAARGLAEVVKTQDPTAPYIAILREAVSDLAAPAESTIGALFALGKVHDDLGAYAAAMEYFRQAHGRERQSIYDRADREARTEELMRVFTRDRIDRLQAESDQTALAVFVVGMPRSGTTLVEQIIAAHPLAHGAGELKYFSAIPDALSEKTADRKPYPSVLEDLSVAKRREVTANYLALLRRHSASALRIVDKLPGNYFHLGLILSLLPNCRVVHCRRDPADVCL